MANYALLDENNIVVQLITGIDESPLGTEYWENYYATSSGYECKRYSINTFQGKHYVDQAKFGLNEPQLSADQSSSFRKNGAGIGYTYDAGRDAFIPPKDPFYASFVLNEDKCIYEPPLEEPTYLLSGSDSTGSYVWNWYWNEAAYTASLGNVEFNGWVTYSEYYTYI